MLIHQGDTNTLSGQQTFRNQQSETTRNWLEADEKYFLHQALSTPVMNVLARKKPYRRSLHL
ncbi:MAG: hypothetical protein KDD15_00160 [Lewinella sp.]|nr:hypothetical protein [Lewinella sp.]